MSQYDKLGEMLKTSLESGNIPKNKKRESANTANKFANSTKENAHTSKTANKTHSTTSENVKKSNKKSNILDKNAQTYSQLYKVFNLEYGCTQEELKTAYHELLKKYHPDNFNGMPETQKIAQRKTQELIKAYNKLAKIVK